MMSATRDEILTAALELSESDRLALVNRLLETLPPDATDLAVDDPDLAKELQRRSGNWDGSVPWEQLRDELRSDR